MWEDCQPLLFLTRKAAREHAAEKYGFIRDRADLRGDPHHWRVPRAVRVVVDIRPANSTDAIATANGFP
jgi:hypothetical protein